MLLLDTPENSVLLMQSMLDVLFAEDEDETEGTSPECGAFTSFDGLLDEEEELVAA